MGNRAVITFGTAAKSPSLYLHWNGGRASVAGFLSAARTLGIEYTTAAKTIEELAHLVGWYFFRCEVGKVHVYLQPYGRADKDNGDNGVYVLDRDLCIDRRLFMEGAEEIDAAKTMGIQKLIVGRVVQNLAVQNLYACDLRD